MHNLKERINKKAIEGMVWLEHNKVEKAAMAAPVVAALSVVSAFAANDAASEVQSILENFTSVIYLVFQGIGFILGVYSVGTLIMAFKNDDPDSKIRSGTTLIIAVVLLLFPTVVSQLGILEKITG